MAFFFFNPEMPEVSLNSSRPRAAPSDLKLLKPIIPSAHVLTIT